MRKLFLLLFFAVHAGAQQPAGDELRRAVEDLSTQVKAQQARLAELEAEVSRLRNALAAPAAAPAAFRTVSATAPAAPQTGRQGLAPTSDAADTVKELQRGLAGFRFSGDFRYRFDVQARSGNNVAGPLQNIRSRYRLRLNVDKRIDQRFDFHVQLSTAPLNNPITNDQDMAGIVAKHFFTIAEAWVDFHPTARIALRGGRMEEVFADGMRFLWDDDVRFNGFQQVVQVPIENGFAGVHKLEIRAGEYILSNPNITILPASSPYVAAGFTPGRKVRAANLFHPGVVLTGGHGDWSYRATSDIHLYRNANQIQLASTAAGYPVVANPALGVDLAGPLGGAGNATATPGGARYSAGHFQIARLALRLERARAFGRPSLPAWVDVQLSRNVGAGRLRDAFMASANIGAVRKPGDMRLLYQYAIKDANSLISQFTDDDLGTATGVNIAVHAFRYDLGLTRALQWQNLLFVQNERRASNPSESFFVPLQRGARATFRYLGQLAFTF